MSAFAQLVWRPSAKDVGTEFAPRTAFLRFPASAANVVVLVDTGNFIPVDQVFLLRHLLLEADPGAAQVLQNLTCDVLQNTTSTGRLLGGPSSAPLIAGGATRLSWQGEIVLTSTEVISAGGTFDLGAAANAVNLTVFGIFMPRGNWQR